MNPRFKFRIWCRGWKPPRFAELKELVIYGSNVNLEQILNNFFNEPLYIVQQSTGLFDKNGKEIFEGDIIKYDTRRDYKRFNIFPVEWSKYTQSGGFECLSLFHKPFGEVIGNILENPELLKK